MDIERRRRTIRIIHRANHMWLALAPLCLEEKGSEDSHPEAAQALHAACESLLDVIEHLHVAVRPTDNGTLEAGR
jgi:hypothetical protein